MIRDVPSVSRESGDIAMYEHWNQHCLIHGGTELRDL